MNKLQENKIRKVIKKVLKEEILKENASILAKGKAWVEKTFDKNDKYKVDDYNVFMAVIEAWKKFISKGYDLSVFAKDQETIMRPREFKKSPEYKWIIAGKPRVNKGSRRMGGNGYYTKELRRMMYNQKDFVKSLGFEQHPTKGKEHMFVISPKYVGKIKKPFEGKYAHPDTMFAESPTLQDTIELMDLTSFGGSDIIENSYHQKALLKLALTGTIK